MFQNVLGFVLLQLCALAAAAPVTAQGQNPWQGGVGGGVVGFIVLVLDIIVWIEVIQSNRPVSHKVLWCVLVFLFPIIGIIAYWLFSNREEHNRRSGYETITGN
ncbi:hypothetical protein BDV96DRAFT_643203 [Lophiotrema nucula]|uniref:Cardiolipin synthase N-terminal domain-containing protein n=1 Tax=Lophiotrema nucula TaxID=690887 RepID=A0A6A5ZIT1_9PLEO|nr:hypothetical protein BDV96DRAFT_643203 [Lophiotrema nucula]